MKYENYVLTVNINNSKSNNINKLILYVINSKILL